jgi:CBS domain-containing protein
LLVKDIKALEMPPTVSLKTTVLNLVKMFLDAPVNHHFYVVDEDNKLLGFIYRKRLFRSLFRHHLHPTTRISRLYSLATAENVEGMINTYFIAAGPEEEIDDVITKMLAHDLYEIPVVDAQGRLVGKLDSIYFLKTWLAENLKSGEI